MAQELVKKLRKMGWQVACAESCTGGLLSAAITDVPGSSACFGFGVVTYSNAAKTKLLAVPKDMLACFGAVSPEVAKAMAGGVRKLAGAQLGIGITGIAGPGGSSAEKPVGLVYVAVSTDTDEKFCKFNFAGKRDAIRQASVQAALQMAKEILR